MEPTPGPVPTPAASFADSISEIGRSAGEWTRLSDVARRPAEPIYKFGVPANPSRIQQLAAAAAKAPQPSMPTRDQAAQQLEHLEETKILLQVLTKTMENAEQDRARAEREQAEQHVFNKRMTLVAIALSFAAVVAPFLIYFLEHGWFWETYRP